MAHVDGSISVVRIIKETVKHYTCQHQHGEKQPFKVLKASEDLKLFFGSADETIDWIEREYELRRAAAQQAPQPPFIQAGSREWRRRQRIVLARYAPKIVDCYHFGSQRHVNSRCRLCDGPWHEGGIEVHESDIRSHRTGAQRNG